MSSRVVGILYGSSRVIPAPTFDFGGSRLAARCEAALVWHKNPHDEKENWERN